MNPPSDTPPPAQPVPDAMETGESATQPAAEVEGQQGRPSEGSGDAAAVALFEQALEAARAGGVAAMVEVGTRYQTGAGVRQDKVAAAGWFLLAAQHGSPAGMVSLGSCFENGKGLLLDFQRAGEYYAAAAKLNYPNAQYLLGQLFEEGRGTAVNLTYAFVNYSRAAAGGMVLAEARRDAVEKQLLGGQKREAEKLLFGR